MTPCESGQPPAAASRVIVRSSRAMIAKEFVPKIRELAPWLKGQLEIGEVA